MKSMQLHTVIIVRTEFRFSHNFFEWLMFNISNGITGVVLNAVSYCSMRGQIQED